MWLRSRAEGQRKQRVALLVELLVTMGSFSVDNDYENGEWIDGEFYATGTKGGNGKRSKEQAFLGVFGDSSDEEEGPRKGGRQRDSRPLASKPVAFTQSSTKAGGTGGQDPVAAPPPKPPVTARAGLGSGGGGGLGFSAASDQPAEKVDRDFGNFEGNTKGFGSRMLEKMGWTKGAGIGKNAQSIVNPLEAKVRPGAMGLGYGGYRETTDKAKTQQKRILSQAEREGASDDSDDEGAARRRREAAKGQPAPAGPKPQYWKKHERRELKVKSAAELRAQWDATGAVGGPAANLFTPAPSPVVDMRGPEARVHASVGSALSAGPGGGEEAADSAGAILPELKYASRS